MFNRFKPVCGGSKVKIVTAVQELLAESSSDFKRLSMLLCVSVLPPSKKFRSCSRIPLGQRVDALDDGDEVKLSSKS